MVGTKRKKEIKQKEIPRGKYIAQGGDPERYYSENPAWTFANSDQEMQAFSEDHMGKLILDRDTSQIKVTRKSNVERNISSRQKTKPFVRVE